MAVALLDSSALIAYILDGDTLHTSATKAVESMMSAGSRLAMSAVTWTEVTYGMLLDRLPEDALVEFVEDFGIDALPVDGYVAERAAELQKAYRDTGCGPSWPRLRTPDALILATADVEGDVTTVIAGDRQWATVPGVSADVVILSESG